MSGLGFKNSVSRSKVEDIARDIDKEALSDGNLYTPGKTYNHIDEDGNNKDFLARDVNGDGTEFTLTSASDFTEIRAKFINKDDPTNQETFIQSTGIKKNGIDILKSDGSIDIELTGGEIWVYNSQNRKWESIPYNQSNPVTVNKRTWDNTDLGNTTSWDFVNSDDGTGTITVNTDSGDYLAPWLFFRENAGTLEFVQLLSEKVYGNQNAAQRQETALPNEFPSFLNSYKLVGKMMARVSETDLNRDRVYRMNSLRDENKLLAVGTTSEITPEILDPTIPNTDPEYSIKGISSVEQLDQWGVSRRVRRIFNISGAFDFTALGYADKTAVYIRNTDPQNGATVTYGVGGAISRDIVWSNGFQQVVPNQDTYNLQPGEIAFMEKDGNTVFISIIPGKRISYFDDYSRAVISSGTITFDGLVVIRDVGEVWGRKTNTNGAAFPADGIENDDWFKLISEDPQTLILDNIQVGIRSSGTNAGSNIRLTFVDKDGVDYPASAWAYSANLVQYTGGTATIITDKAQYNGSIGVGRNKQGTVKFYYIGSNPNGISQIRIDSAVATATQNVIITYQGTNYNDSFSNIGLLNRPLPWTTFQEQESATDQAAYITELTEYTGDKVFSMREPDSTDPDYNKLFNWQVKTGQTVLDTEITDTSNEAELIAIKPKLERFGIGTVTPEGLLDDWKPNTAYNSRDRFVAPMPINADFISNNGAEAGLNYIFQTNVATPDTITAFDDTQADSGNYDLIGVFSVNGTDVRVLTGSGTMGLDPLNSLSNSATNEFIKWTTTDTPQTIRLLPSPSFVTVWEDYTGENIVQPTAANEDFVLPANSNMQVTRVGNAIKFVFKSNEGGATGEIYTTVASNEIGTLKQVPNVKEDGTAKVNQDYIDAGLLPLINGYTLADGATNNPKFALIFPSFVNGNDLVVPNTFDGNFVRNLGGNAAAFMVSQTDATAVNGMDVDGPLSNRVGVSGGPNRAWFADSGESNQAFLSSSDPETRPINFAMQFCLVLDSYSKSVAFVVGENLTVTNPNESDTTKVLKPNGDGTATFQNNIASSTPTFLFATLSGTGAINVNVQANSGTGIAVTNASNKEFTVSEIGWYEIELSISGNSFGTSEYFVTEDGTPVGGSGVASAGSNSDNDASAAKAYIQVTGAAKTISHNYAVSVHSANSNWISIVKM